MSKLAICVPTINHADVVEGILDYAISFLADRDVDMYYYDSSDGDDTERVIKQEMERFSSANVWRIALPKGTEYGEKMDLIFSGYGFQKDYEYVWPIKDRLICNERMLDLVLDQCGCGRDLILVPGRNKAEDRSQADVIEIDGSQDLYRDYATQITSLETVIYNRRSMLADYQYGSVQCVERYLSDFWHYHMVFTKVAEKTSPDLCAIVAEDAQILSSTKGASLWTGRIFEIWIEEWLQMNHSLPSLYDPYKEKVIRDTASIEELIGDRGKMMQLHESGYLTPEVFEKYRDSWQAVSYVPTEVIEQIARGEYDPFHDLTIYHAQDDAEKILLKIAQLLSREDQRAGIGDIPLENLKKIVLDRVLHQTRYDQMEALIYGTVLDLFEEYAGTESAERKKKILQTLLLLLR